MRLDFVEVALPVAHIHIFENEVVGFVVVVVVVVVVALFACEDNVGLATKLHALY